MVKLSKKTHFNLGKNAIKERHKAIFAKARMFEIMGKNHDLVMDDEYNLQAIETSSR